MAGINTRFPSGTPQEPGPGATAGRLASSLTGAAPLDPGWSPGEEAPAAVSRGDLQRLVSGEAADNAGACPSTGLGGPGDPDATAALFRDFQIVGLPDAAASAFPFGPDTPRLGDSF